MVFLWQTLAKRVAEERTVDLTGEIEILDIEKRRAISISDVNKRIQGLEGLYQKYDLIHNFIRFFGMPNTREEQNALSRKKSITVRKKNCFLCCSQPVYTKNFLDMKESVYTTMSRNTKRIVKILCGRIVSTITTKAGKFGSVI